MPDARREQKIAAAKRKLRQFKQKRGKESKHLKDDSSSIASDDVASINTCHSDETLLDNSRNELNQVNIVEIVDKATSDECIVHDVVDTNSIDFEADAVRIEPEIFDDMPQNELTGNEKTEDECNKPESLHSDTVRQSSETDSSLDLITISNSDNVNTNVKDSLSETEESPVLLTASDSDDNVHILHGNMESTETITTASNLNNKIAGNQTEEKSQYPSNQTETSSTLTAEKLHQISTKLNGLAAEAQSVASPSNGNVTITTTDRFVLSELEHRNQLLAEQVESVTRQKQELMRQVDSLTQQMSELRQRLETEKQQIYAHGINEQNTLRQQLQVQMQTISILVAEKQELQHQIHEARAAATRDQNSRERMQDQLQDSKLRVQTLEREIRSNTDSIESLNTAKSELTKERDQLQHMLTKMTKSGDESSMQVKELSQKLYFKENECTQLSTELDDLHEKLSMAEVLLQQLSNSSGATAETQLHQLQEERESLNQKLIEYQQAFEQLTGEREQLSRQYEDVNTQMQKQVSELSQQIELLGNEKGELQTELEKVEQNFQQLKLENAELNTVKNTNENENTIEEMSKKLQEIVAELSRVTAERDETNHKFNVQLRNNERLARLNEEQEAQLSELGRNISESVVSADEHARLLDQSQSDKATISRALSQNKQLKQQLEEMQDGFIKLSNDKMDLANELATTNHARKELEDEIEMQKATLSQLEQELATRTKHIDNLQTSISEQPTQPHPAEDKVIIPADETKFNIIRNELSASQDTVNILSEQNSQLKDIITKLQGNIDVLEQQRTTEAVGPNDSDTVVEAKSSESMVTPEDDQVEKLSVTVQKLEEEKNELARQFDEERRQHGSLMEQFLNMQQIPKQDQTVSVEEHEELLRNMGLLQDRFMLLMKEKVEALNKVEELEHVNLQLQNECDTIGEYITLYHNQRQILKQRHHEKDEYVSSMAQEREQLQLKLEKLQSLVLSLLQSRGIENVPSSAGLLSSTRNSDEEASDETQLVTGTSSELPDMLDEDGKHQRKPRPDLLPETASLPSYSDTESEGSQSPHFPGKLQRVEESGTRTPDSSTASEIINLLEQMQKPGSTMPNDMPGGFCLRYMGPYTAI